LIAQGQRYVLESAVANSDNHIGPDGIPYNTMASIAGKLSQYFLAMWSCEETRS